MKTLTVKDSKYGFGRLMDLVRAGSEAVPKKRTPRPCFNGAGPVYDRTAGEVEGDGIILLICLDAARPVEGATDLISVAIRVATGRCNS